MVGSLPVGEGDTGSGPSPGGSSMPRGSWALGSRLLSLRSGAREPQLLSLRAMAAEARAPGECAAWPGRGLLR